MIAKGALDLVRRFGRWFVHPVLRADKSWLTLEEDRRSDYGWWSTFSTGLAIRSWLVIGPIVLFLKLTGVA